MKKNIEDDRRIENVFLAYANFNLKDNPQNLNNIVDTIQNKFSRKKEDFPNKIIRLICQIKHSPDTAKPKSKSDLTYLDNNKIAEDAVFNYRNNGCVKRCMLFFKEYKRDNNLKCYECFQRFFIYILTELSQGTEYLEIKDWDNLNNFNNLYIRNYYLIDVYDVPQSIKFKQVLKKHFGAIDYFDMAHEEIEERSGSLIYQPVKHSFFNGYIFENVVSCFMEFLLKDERNRERIKICPDCNKFFVTSKFDPRIKKCSECSPKSKKSKEYNREYAKRYRKVLKEKRTAKEKELAIKRYMERAGITRREAEKIWDLDHNKYSYF